MSNNMQSIDFHDLDGACDASVNEAIAASNEQIKRHNERVASIRTPVAVNDPSKVSPFQPKTDATNVDLGVDGNIDTPQQIMAKEIKAAQAVADAIDAKRAGLMSEASRRALEIRAAQERLAKLNEAQKGTMERIRACDKAAQVHRQTVFALQESGR